MSDPILQYVNRPDFPLAVTISVDNRRLVARLVPAGTRTEAEVGEELGMVGVEGVSKVWLRGSWLQLEFDTHRSYLLTWPVILN